MARSIEAITAAVFCSALASCASPPSIGVTPGSYIMTVTADVPPPHPACLAFAGQEALSFRDGSATTDLFSPLQLTVDSNGGVTGAGIESMTGFSAVTKLAGQRTNTGYEGTLVGTAYSVDCTGRWRIMRQ